MTGALFITGTGTDVGKTVVASLVAQGFEPNRKVIYWKPVQAGSEKDAATIARLAHVTCLPPVFDAPIPCSPDQAATQCRLAAATCAQLFIELRRHRTQNKDVFLVIEGAGGLLVPLNEQNETWADFLVMSGIPVLVVGTSGLGTLNHIGLTREAINGRAINILGYVLAGSPHLANVASLHRMYPEENFFVLPELPGLAENPLWQTQATELAAFVERQLQSATSPDWQIWDHEHVWHPFTQHQTAPTPLAVTKAQGVWLTTADGLQLMDGIGSWWVNNLGHGRRDISVAVQVQAAALDHVQFAGTTHQPAARFAHQLCAWAGEPFQRVFYSDNGSTAVEVALKMAYQGWVNRGELGRTTFLSLAGSYHGDTFGSMSVAGAQEFYQPFRPLLFRSHFIKPFTSHPSRFNHGDDQTRQKLLNELREFLVQENKTIAGVIVEPLVQGAGGMLMHDAGWLRACLEKCREYQLPIIFDEVFTGIGRLGEAFGFQRLRFVPDIVCVAKGLTGGVLPLAATVTTQSIYEEFLSESTDKALLHGHSFTANPIACAAACTAAEILNREQLFQRAYKIEKTYQEWISANCDTIIHAPRALGSILAFDLVEERGGTYFSGSKFAADVTHAALTSGLLIRPLGNTVYLTPPLTTTDGELTQMLEKLSTSLALSRQ